MTNDPIPWLLESDEPWTRYRTLVDLVGCSEDDARVQAARAEMVAHRQIQVLVTETAGWPGYTLKRHNDAKHPIYKFSTLADFGLCRGDPGMAPAIDLVMAHQADDGPFQTPVNIPKAFGGTGEDVWTWIACDAPTLVYALLAFGMAGDERVQRAVEHIVGSVDDNGWRCKAAPELGGFKGPGSRDDPCPIVNVYALKVLSQIPELLDGPAAHAGAETLLGHWEHQRERKMYLFGIGTDFRKLKYPFVWYDIIHVTDVLSRFPFVRADARFREMVRVLANQADMSGCYTATSMYKAWKGWSFADKKAPSPWLTFLALRVQKRSSA